MSVTKTWNHYVFFSRKSKRDHNFFMCSLNRSWLNEGFFSAWLHFHMSQQNRFVFQSFSSVLVAVLASLCYQRRSWKHLLRQRENPAIVASTRSAKTDLQSYHWDKSQAGCGASISPLDFCVPVNVLCWQIRSRGRSLWGDRGQG